MGEVRKESRSMIAPRRDEDLIDLGSRPAGTITERRVVLSLFNSVVTPKEERRRMVARPDRPHRSELQLLELDTMHLPANRYS